jgi:hypothetical protein
MKAFCNKELNLNLDNNPLVIAPFCRHRELDGPPLQQHFMLGKNYNPREPPHHYLKNSVFILLDARLMRNCGIKKIPLADAGIAAKKPPDSWR